MAENRLITKLMLKEDWNFLSSCLHRVQRNEWEHVKKIYKEKFLAGIDAEENVNKKINAGRRKANRWLVENLETSNGNYHHKRSGS